MRAILGFIILGLFVFVGWIGYIVVSGIFIWPPPIPTSPGTRRRMIAAIQRYRPTANRGELILDPGCGFGGLALALAQAFPGSNVIGIDLQRFPLLVARLRAKLFGLPNLRFRHANLFIEDYTIAQVVACYLYPNVMQQLRAKWEADLQQGCVVVSNLHPVPHWQPDEVIQGTDWALRARAVYVYCLPRAKIG